MKLLAIILFALMCVGCTPEKEIKPKQETKTGFSVTCFYKDSRCGTYLTEDIIIGKKIKFKVLNSDIDVNFCTEIAMHPVVLYNHKDGDYWSEIPSVF